MNTVRGYSIGKIAARTGLAVSAIRFYEEAGLVAPERNSGGQRVFAPSDIRRISFVMIAQKLGFTLAQIRAQLDILPDGRTPTLQDWEAISASFSVDIEARISALQNLQKKLTGCIGCGCLSLQKCALYNTDDIVAAKGAGPRYLMGDRPPNSDI